MQIMTFHLGLLICLTARSNNEPALRTVGPGCSGARAVIGALALPCPPFLRGEPGGLGSQMICARWMFVSSSPTPEFQGFGAKQVQIFILLSRHKTSAIWSEPGSDCHPPLPPQTPLIWSKTSSDFHLPLPSPDFTDLKQPRFRFSSSPPSPKLQ